MCSMQQTFLIVDNWFEGWSDLILFFYVSGNENFKDDCWHLYQAPDHLMSTVVEVCLRYSRKPWI